VEGRILGKVKGGFNVDVGVPGFLPGSHVEIRPSRNLDRFIGTYRPFHDPQVQPRPRQRRWSHAARYSNKNATASNKKFSKSSKRA
jgi:ribosomal protein S1